MTHIFWLPSQCLLKVCYDYMVDYQMYNSIMSKKQCIQLNLKNFIVKKCKILLEPLGSNLFAGWEFLPRGLLLLTDGDVRC